ncbi:hypothetical protein CHGG_05327 [Chaetomium globosum CBS 148.51]|uniref:Peptidase S8/S53 domain-containing protein n=1 Tax=Chaetomium globosum (strain ATCC 6205 / CBS 148.51 / DSM 1962 / NBRC 6347 / NRRL 1970) TaxID=306901 RepID=Q2H7N8_CHAGB|nr:uncharacterized protein CHGG_05327 [Chaetomium globosum CBS 148.51]EAQ88708.1 hypothetical protein CHGG_05327 [Chaetomium globosum CBS 148.51]
MARIEPAAVPGKDQPTLPSSMVSQASPIEPHDSEGPEPFGRSWHHPGQRQRKMKGAKALTRSLEEQRVNLLEKIKEAGRDWPNRPGIKEAARPCLRGDNWTILHWVLWRADHGTKGSDLSWNLEASLALVQLSLQLEPDLLLAKDKKEDTALHKALAMASDAEPDQHFTFEQLANWMCKSAGDATVKKVLDITNSFGETCVHIAVVGQLEIANNLVLLSDARTLLRQRRSEQKGSVQNNTALHDAVAYERNMTTEARCKEQETCPKCSEAEHHMWKKRERVLQLVKNLIQKAPSALTIMNSDNESPYRYYLATKAYATSHGNADAGTQGRTIQSIPGVKEDGMRSFPQPRIDNASLTGDMKLGMKAEKPKPDQLLGGHTKASLNGEDGGSEEPDEPTEQCPNPVPSDSIVAEVERYLFEGAFTLGGFEKACECFFGKVGDKNYKDPNFRPGHALGMEEQKGYSFLKPPKIMSLVDLIVPVTKPEPQEPKTAHRSLEESQQEFRNLSRTLWEQDMDAMRGVFGMLAGMGVERILKLIVTDDAGTLTGGKKTYQPTRSSPRLRGLPSYGCTPVAGMPSSKGFESYEKYIENIQSFDTRLKQNIAHSRFRRVLQCKMETSRHRLVYEETQHERDSRELQSVQEHLAELRAERHEVPKLGVKNEQTADTESDAELAEEIDEYKEEEEYLVDNLEKAQKIMERYRTTLESTSKECRQLDHQMADCLNTRMQSIKVFESNRKSHISTVKDGTTVAFKPSPYPPLLGKSLQGHHHTFFLLSHGSVASNFDLRTIMDDPPRKKTVDDTEIALEEVDEIEATTKHRWLESVDQFVSKLPYDGGRGGETDFRVKVALIDDGVDANQDIFADMFGPEGWPVLEPGSKRYPFYKSAAGHGTEMAKLIRRVCPKIELYVAKLGDWTDQERVERLGEVSTAENAAKAVDWAIRRHVHIISMSWSLVKVDANKEQIALLDSKIQEAARKGIIMYCAAADQGQYGSDLELYPARADTKHVKAVGSARENGAASTSVDPSQVEYLFPGEEIEELGKRKGSSAATALASGLAALVLCCFEKQLGKGGSSRIANPKNMHEVFEKLKAKDSKWVDATRLFKEGNTIETVVKLCTKWIT